MQFPNVVVEREVKDNLIKIAQDHRKNCQGPECDIQLMLLYKLLLLAGIDVTEQEFNHFK